MQPNEYLTPHFKRKEFACKCGCGFDTVDIETVLMLEEIRAHFGAPITINSGCRCRAHNSGVGGSLHSQHMKGRAADIVVEGVEPSKVQAYLKERFAGLYGIGMYNTFTHFDTRTNGPARWSG